jgi:hypothetical protein
MTATKVKRRVVDIKMLNRQLERARSKKSDIYQILRYVHMLRARGEPVAVTEEELNDLDRAIEFERRRWSLVTWGQVACGKYSIRHDDSKPHPGYMIPRLLLLKHVVEPFCTERFEVEDWSAICAAFLLYEQNAEQKQSLKETLELLCTKDELAHYAEWLQ